ncbi:MAG: zinc-ribbon domain-containing protein [Clostridiales bacterium]|jgi:ribosomal protein L40E|nr:zinc-ribbon domain-containing protein [Clostridiales bacterium]
MDNLKETAIKLATNIQKTSREFLKTTKMSIAITNEEERLKSIYIDIGKKVHEIYMYGGTLGKVFDEKYADILACETRLQELRDKLDDLKGTSTCPKCGKNAERDAEFCPRCGMKMNEPLSRPAESHPGESHPVESRPEPPAPAEEKPKPKKICLVCGAENEDGVKYCGVCGRMII